VAKISREQFNFTEGFQHLVLACLLRKPDFARYASLISAKYFTGSISTITALGIFKYHKKHGHFPSKETLTQIVSAEAEKQGEVEDSMEAYVEKLFTIKIKDWKHVLNQVVSFCKERELLKAMQKGIEYFKKGEEPPGGYVQLFEKAVAVGDAYEEPARPMIDISETEIDPNETLLGMRWLCRGGGALMVGPSGIGKSSGSVQMDVRWSMGRTAFGIKPNGPLKILVIQAENDDGDLQEMIKGALSALSNGKRPPSHKELALCRENLLVVTERAKTGEDFVQGVLETYVRRYGPDLIRIDPLQAYLGADPIDTQATAKFLRNLINPILTRNNCGIIINHHTPKTTNRDSTNWRGSDWMYAGAGSADITNWARAILVIDPTHDPRTFKFIAAKRGGRIGWEDTETGQRESIRHYCHSAQDEVIAWVRANQSDLLRVEQAKPAGVRRKPPTPDEIMDLVPADVPIPKNELIVKAKTVRIGLHSARALLASLVEAGRLSPGRGCTPRWSLFTIT
jgi:hypothetical protein